MTEHLYRHFDKDGVLLYVGVSNSALRRLGQHEAHAHWFDSIASVTIQNYETREAVLEAERVAITTEKPLHNVMRPAPYRSLQAQASRDDLTGRLVQFNPLYTLKDVARFLDLRPIEAVRLVESNALSHVVIESIKTKEKRRVTGWQLIEYLEHLENRQEAS